MEVALPLPRKVMRWLGIFGLGGLGISMLIFAARNLGNHYFWTDESATFFTALGWPGPGQPPGDFAAIWSTMLTFVDPGGYQLLVRAWTEVFGTSIVALRLLPFIFFVGYVMALLKWYRLAAAPWIIAAAGASLMLVENITPYYAVELRPYSVVLAAAVALPLLVNWFLTSPTWSRLITYCTVFCLVASVHFSMATVAVGCAALLMVFSARASDLSSRLRLVIGALVSVGILPLIHLVTRGNPLADKESTLTYINDLMLRYQGPDEVLRTLVTNLITPTALPRTLFIALVPILWLAFRKTPHRQWLTDQTRPVLLLWLYVTVTLAASAVMSWSGFLPWVVGTRWSIVDIGYIALSLVGLTALVLRTPWVKRRPVAWVLVAAAIACCLVGDLRLARYQRMNDVDYMAALAPAVLSGTPGRAKVDGWIYGDARYWMEYSGQHPDTKNAWMTHGIQAIPPYTAATDVEIRQFLESRDDRLLLRSLDALRQSGVSLPPNVTIVQVDPSLLNGTDPNAVPIVLVKQGLPDS